MKQDAAENVWAIVLAAGRGTRLANVTRTLCGRELPKQFVALTSRRTLLQETMDRIAPLVPPERTVVIVSDDHADLAREQLADYPGVEIVEQPLDRGTGAGILLSLSHVLARDPKASVAIFPSDHHVHRPGPFLNAVRRALRLCERTPTGVALLGVAAERPASDLGWIVPGERVDDHGSRVQSFVEKPAPEKALMLLEAGGLWNTMVVVGGVSALWRLGRRHMPEQTRALEAYLPFIGRPEATEKRHQAYTTMPVADFSRQVLQATTGLAVVPVIDSGWFDCGTPERLFEWLAATADPPGILARLRKVNGRAADRRLPEAATLVA